MLLYLLFLYWHLLENWWRFSLPQVLSSEVHNFEVYNWKKFGHRWCTSSYLLVFFHVQGKIRCCTPLLYFPPLVPGVPTHRKNISPMSFCVYHIWLGVCIQVTPSFIINDWVCQNIKILMVCQVLWYLTGVVCNEIWPHIIVYFIQPFKMSCGVFIHQLGCGTYRVRFHP